MERKPRKYWPSGNSSFVTTLPNNWVKDYAKEFSEKEIMVTQIGETLLFTPKKNPPAEKPLPIEMKPSDASRAYYSIISAYIQDYSEVCLVEKGYSRSFLDKIMLIQNKLPGATIQPKSEGEYKVTFVTEPEPIPTILDKMYGHYKQIYEKNKDLFTGLDEKENINTKFNFVQYTEEEVDKMGFLLKRLFTRVFNTVLFDPTILETTGLSKGKDTDYSVVSKSVAYSVVASNLERITDIQVGIFRTLKDIALDEKGRKSLGIHKDYGFDDYYNAAHQMVTDAYQSKDNLKLLLKVLNSEDRQDGDVCYREGYIDSKQRRQALKLAEESQSLSSLEGSIWANTGLATNIAEAWINMRDLE